MGDLAGISACYAIPSLILGGEASFAVTSRAQLEAAFDAAAEGQQEHGEGSLVAARPAVTWAESISGALVTAEVRWDYLDDHGEVGERDFYRYILRMDETTGPLLQVAMAIDRPHER